MRKNTLSFIINFLARLLAIAAVFSAVILIVLWHIFPIPYIWIPFVAFPLIIPATMIFGSGVRYSSLNSLVYTISNHWLPLFLYSFLAAIPLGLLLTFQVPLPALQNITVGFFAVIVIVLIYGIWNAKHPTIKKYQLKAPLLKEKWGDKKIVLISDVHIGMILHDAWLKKVVGMINSLSPDIVFIAGDLVDGPLFPYEKFLAPLKDIRSTYGTFYTAGNHDEYNREPTKYYAELEKNATILDDEMTMVNDTQIIGIMFAEESKEETKKRLAKTGYDKAKPSIMLLHDPKNVSALADEGATLTLSGHTHGGQFFPLTLLIKSIYKGLGRGVSYLGNTAHFTSVGVGTAGPVFRVGANPEVVVIEIV